MKKRITKEICATCKHFEQRGYCSKHKEETNRVSWCCVWKKPAIKKDANQ